MRNLNEHIIDQAYYGYTYPFIPVHTLRMWAVERAKIEKDKKVKEFIIKELVDLAHK